MIGDRDRRLSVRGGAGAHLVYALSTIEQRISGVIVQMHEAWRGFRHDRLSLSILAW